MSAQVNSLVLVNLEGSESFIFRFFPSSIEVGARANWRAQDVTIGVKPLAYANREPRQIRFDGLWLDNTHTGDSITPEIEQLTKMMEETVRGTPPPLLALWGDRQERCVLEELTVVEEFFNADGTPIRASLQMSLLQLQEESPAPAPVRRNEKSHITF
ncbi:MAG: hypothetical protein H0T60_14055 [Acidobacteria bacterium]|nr:hypothetical protein [Acidobacteriota bacterium]